MVVVKKGNDADLPPTMPPGTDKTENETWPNEKEPEKETKSGPGPMDKGTTKKEDEKVKVKKLGRQSRKISKIKPLLSTVEFKHQSTNSIKSYFIKAGSKEKSSMTISSSARADSGGGSNENKSYLV